MNHSGQWWESIGLRYSSLLLVSSDERAVQEAVLEVLREHPPVAFANGASGAPELTVQQLGELVRHTTAQVELDEQQRRVEAAEERRVYGWEQVEAALSESEDDDPMRHGPWAGLTWGEARAWCWNLFQYEPHGFVLPGSLLRQKALAELEEGGLPDVFGYPKRARELAALGLSPRDYRQHKEALGEMTYTPEDVKTS